MVAARTPARRGPTFVCARRRGLCSMSGRYPYGIGNPPTLRRSSFPQRALRPAGGPIPKHTWGCAPRPPNAQAAAGYERCKHRPYGTADTLSRCLRRILFGFCRPIAESYAAKTMGRTSNYLDRRPLPRHGGGERGCEAERRQWRMQRGGAPAAVEKIEQASSAKIFSGTARRWGQMRLRLPLERICAQYGFGFFAPEKSKFVASTAKRQRGLSRGKLGPP